MEHLHERLAAGGVIVLDGGTGSEIEARGVAMDAAAWSAPANLTHADVVRSVHEDYIRAGADVVIANTFASGPGALAAQAWGSSSRRSTAQPCGWLTRRGSALPTARCSSPDRCL